MATHLKTSIARSDKSAANPGYKHAGAGVAGSNKSPTKTVSRTATRPIPDQPYRAEGHANGTGKDGGHA